MRKFIGALGVLVCLVFVGVEAEAKSNSSNLNKERLEVGRALLEVTASNIDEILPYYTDDIEYFDPIVSIDGKAEMTEFLYRLFAGTPDLVTLVEDEIAVDDQYMATWEMVGTFFVDPSDPSTGVEYVAKGMSIIKFRPKTTDAYFQRDYYSEGDIMLAIPPLSPAISGFRELYRCIVEPNYVCQLPPAP